MAVTLRFRPVLFGPPSRPAMVLHLEEGPDGRAWFRERELALPLDVPLQAASVEDLPPPYQGAYRGQRFEVTILPVQETAGADDREAFDRMLAALAALERRQAQTPSAGRQRRPIRARRSA